ncbi:MAG TPA: hypothetical protein VKA38_01835 [Draconibacterium sp.]|nr:hypothetical protein [Draconibacterium sp.]
MGNSIKYPPVRSKNVLTDAWYFLFKKPKTNTLVKFDSVEKRDEYNQRVMQRVGIEVNKNSILNIHQIGVDVPVSYVFNELLNWNGDSTCWPNHVAKVQRIDDDIERIKILPFGWSKYPFGFKKSFFGIHIIPLFYLNSVRIKRVPDSFDFDNARYLLYRSSGGYPIGIFTMYVRSSIVELGETAHSQLIFAVSFNFYGKEKQARKWVNRIWESVHNRVTSNVLNRIKQLSEWRIEKLKSKLEYL